MTDLVFMSEANKRVVFTENNLEVLNIAQLFFDRSFSPADLSDVATYYLLTYFPEIVM